MAPPRSLSAAAAWLLAISSLAAIDSNPAKGGSKACALGFLHAAAWPPPSPSSPATRRRPATSVADSAGRPFPPPPHAARRRRPHGGPGKSIAAIASKPLRAGSISASAGADDGDGDGDGDTTPGRRRLGMSAALFATYFAVMGAKCALPSTLGLLTAPGSGLSFPESTVAGTTPQQAMARVLALSTVAIAWGKFLLGPVIDRLGGPLCLGVALSVLGSCLGVIASASQFAVFARCWVLVDFVFSACWAACLNAVHGSFPRSEWAGKVGMLAAAARTGNAAAFATFAAVLGWARGRAESAASATATAAMTAGSVGQEWRAVFWASAAAQTIPLALLAAFGRRESGGSKGGKPADAPERPSFRASLRVLRREAATPLFWLHLTSRSVLMVYASFLLFVPSLMSDCFGMTSAGAARVGSAYALGCLASVTAGSGRYGRMGRRRRAIVDAIQLGVATGCALAMLAHVSGMVNLSAFAGSSIMVLWGASFAIPFYIPPSLFALSRGGKESSATIADAFDFGGFSLLAAFNGYVAGIQRGAMGEWKTTFALLATCAAVSMACLLGAFAIEERGKGRNVMTKRNFNS